MRKVVHGAWELRRGGRGGRREVGGRRRRRERETWEHRNISITGGRVRGGEGEDKEEEKGRMEGRKEERQRKDASK